MNTPATATKLKLTKKGSEYVANVTLSKKSVPLILDMQLTDVYVQCEAFNGTAGCPTACPSQLSLTKYGGDYYCIDQYVKFNVTLGGVVATDMWVNVLYNSRAAMQAPDNVLGLGSTSPRLDKNTLFASGDVQSFALSLDDAAPHLMLNGVDATLVRSKQLTAYTFAKTSAIPWTIHPTGLQFGDDTPQYPCEDAHTGVCGVTFNHRASKILMFDEDYDDFYAKYLMVCSTYETETWECYGTADDFPRITIGFGDKVLYIDPTDYVRPSSKTGKVLVYVGPSSSQTSWELGMPFFKKFYPSFNIANGSVTIYCREGENCDIKTLVPVNKPRESGKTAGGGGTSADESDGGRVVITKGGVKTAVYLGIAGAVVLLIVLAVLARCLCGVRCKFMEDENDEDENTIGRTSKGNKTTRVSGPRGRRGSRGGGDEDAYADGSTPKAGSDVVLSPL